MSTNVYNSSKHKKKKHHRHVDEYSEVMRREKAHSGELHSFCPKPKRVSFDSQLTGEIILLLLRQHIISQWQKFFIIFLGLVFPFLIAATPVLEFLPTNYQIAFYTFWALMLMGYTFEAFLTWFFNVYIITDERVIDVDFVSLLYKNISSAKIDRVEDITHTAGGFLASVVDYGSVKIQTAAEENEFEFDNVPRPALVTEFLNELLVEEEREKIEGRVS